MTRYDFLWHALHTLWHVMIFYDTLWFFMTCFAHAMIFYDSAMSASPPESIVFTPRNVYLHTRTLCTRDDTPWHFCTRFAHAMTRSMTFYDIAMSASPRESIVFTPINVYVSTYKYIHATCACAHAYTACACATHAHAHAQHAHACTPKTAMSRRHRRGAAWGRGGAEDITKCSLYTL